MTNVSYKDIIEAVNNLETKIDKRFDEVKDEFVIKSEFNLVRVIVFTMCGIILIAFLNNVISISKGDTANAFKLSVIPTETVKSIGDTIAKIK